MELPGDVGLAIYCMAEDYTGNGRRLKTSVWFRRGRCGDFPPKAVINIQQIWVVVKIMVPCWIPILIRHLIFRVPKKGP